MVFKSYFALLLVASVVAIALAQAPTSGSNDVVVFVQSTESGSAIPSPSVSCSLSGNTYTPTTGASLWELHFNMPPGTYECDIDVAGFYRYQRPLVAASNSSSHMFYVAPVRPGITILPETSKRQGLGALLNMTFPSGVFPFDFAAAGYSVAGAPVMTEGYYYGSGTPSASFYFSFASFQLSAAQAGTYRVGFSTNYGNFSASTHLFFIFGGLDQQNGFFKTVSSDAVPAVTDAKWWYAGDIIVTNPAYGCAVYNWTDVNEYSLTVGFNQDTHTAVDKILEECYDTSPAALMCTSMLFNSSVPVSTCGAFGDPHVIMFNGTGVTCGIDSIITLVDNQYIEITAQTLPSPGATNGATDITAITIRYKSVCNPITVTFSFNSSNGEISPFLNSPLAGNHRARIVGNNIYIDAIRLRLQVRRVGVYVGATLTYNVVFGLSMPSSLISSSVGICADGCPAGTAVSLGTRKKSFSARTLAAAADTCTDAGLATGTFAYDACIFDVATTGSTDYADVAKTSDDVNNDVRTSWDSDPVDREPITAPEDSSSNPSASPSASPSAPASTGPTATPSATPSATPTISTTPEPPTAAAPTPESSASTIALSSLVTIGAIAFALI